LEQADIELQLKVWKELAVSKQMLMQKATNLLGLSKDCSSEEFENALNKNATQVKAVQSELKKEQETSAKIIEDLQAQLKASQQLNNQLEAERDDLQASIKKAEEQVIAGKEANADELKKIKSQLAEKQKEIKQITKVLADTPENVVKKLKALRKEKLDEANARKKAEDLNRKVKKEKDTQEIELKQVQASLEKAVELADKYQELDSFANKQYDLLVAASKDKDSVEKVPKIDEATIELIKESQPKSKK